MFCLFSLERLWCLLFLQFILDLPLDLAMTCPLIFSAQRYLTWEAFTDLLPPQHFLFLVPALFFFITLKTSWFICLSIYHQFSSVQSLSRVWLFVIPMDCSTPGLPIHCQLLEFTQTHVHWVNDAIQPSQPLSSPSPPAFNLSQHQGLFSESALHIRWPKYWSFSFKSVLPMNTQDWSPLGWTGWNSLQSKGLSRVFFNTIVQKHQFFGTQLSL